MKKKKQFLKIDGRKSVAYKAFTGDDNIDRAIDFLRRDIGKLWFHIHQIEEYIIKNDNLTSS